MCGEIYHKMGCLILLYFVFTCFGNITLNTAIRDKGANLKKKDLKIQGEKKQEILSEFQNIIY